MAEPKSYGRDGEGLEPINETTHEDCLTKKGNDFDTTARSTGDGQIDYEGGFLKTIVSNSDDEFQRVRMSYEGASERRDRMSRLTTLTLEIEGRRVDGGLRMSRSRGRRMNRGRWVVQHKTGKEEQSDSDERRGTPRRDELVTKLRSW
ncbi:hypothetical protein PPACK8108_LOCUS17488 [Phakopsora pachyrhizi]|uniref:Uncharacterized protein n=1 Tax=Phakopsora pachyrhizi TaxID=170000 RepID=A0AAV0B9G1_PHAPC|nr:hypothetical protein PPACK8108_LOCUS17488 [Phakopsora pachyrhizi]